MTPAQERARARYRASEKYRAADQARRERAKEPRTCSWCQTSFTVYRWKPTRTCSRVCAQAVRRAVRTQIALRDHHTPQATLHWKTTQARLMPTQRPPRRRWYAGHCPACGTPWVHDQPQTRTCSPRCQKLLAKHKRRALKREAFVSPVSPRRTFERDGWICQLCSRPVDRAQQVPQPMAPVLDHIVPLAQGGTHEPGNTQCAHFLCNSIKGHRITTAQPMLF
ncbi:HNH endonuclease [Streptomyces sp. E11-3]|uniref:HNH endonuclease n=1 Tax=Streptomyces sp. E11-3 TaxID=3110112 RepID=UPI00397FDC46